MKLHLDAPAGRNLISGYGEHYVTVNGVRHERNLVVTPGEIVTDWLQGGFRALTAEHFASLLAFKPEIVLLGTGASIRFPAPGITSALAEAHVGCEVMDTGAACRTYDVLVAEGRRVVAALIVD
jgi:uncharacterized protein